MRLIDADALPLFLKVFTEIKNAPTVDAVPVVHGTWKTVDELWGDEHSQCSNCGEEWVLNDGTPEENNMHYCPNCGAKMDEKEETNNEDT